MKILQVHCRSNVGRGGEDSVLEEEFRLLQDNGHSVAQFFGDNASSMPKGPWQPFARGLLSIWNASAAHALESTVHQLKPDVIHVHNTFAALSPAVFWALKRTRIPVVLTLHNYRLACANSLLLRHEQPCTACVGRYPWPALWHRCAYGNSVAAGACSAGGQFVHKALSTYRRCVDAFIALTGFQRQMMIEAGLPPERVHVKPNFVHDHSGPTGEAGRRSATVAFMGGAVRTKGIDLLLSAWARCGGNGHRLALMGYGLESPGLATECGGRADIDWVGRLERKEALLVLKQARWLVMASRCYEGCPMVILEALARGTPVIAPDHGCFPSIIQRGKNALLFPANDATGLAGALQDALAMQSPAWESFSAAARSQYLQQYTPDSNYRDLMNIYETVMHHVNHDRVRTLVHSR